MPIGAIERIVYGVDDLAASAQFFNDFGLVCASQSADEVVYCLEEGSKVILRHIDDPSLPAKYYEGNGVRETIFGVDTKEELQKYAVELAKDREIRWDEDGKTIHFIADPDIPIGLTVWTRKAVCYAPDAVNAPDNVKRLNQHRRWRYRAKPKTINHIVYRVVDPDVTRKFFVERLDFRVTDIQPPAGFYLRAQGFNQHHSMFLLKHDFLPPFHLGIDHVAFGVEDIDEVAAGWNYMERRGYKSPLEGIGRHRISSALFCYINSPLGSMAEYHADPDFLDDNWVPRVWTTPPFGAFMWTAKVLPYLQEEYKWDVSFDHTNLPDGSIPKKTALAPDSLKD